MPMGVSHNCTFLRDFVFPLNFLFLAVMLRAPSFFSCRLLLTTGLIELLSATVIDSKDLSEGRVSLPIDLWIPAEQCNEGYLSNIKPKKEKMIESVEQNRDDDFDEIEFYYDTQGEPHIDSEKEMYDSNEDDIISVKSIKQQNKRHVRKLGIIN